MSDDPLKLSYDNWKRTPNEATTNAFVQSARPIIDRALSAYGAKSPALLGHAKLLTIKSLQNYDESRKVPLKNWVYTQLQPLRRARAATESLGVPERIRRQLFDVKQFEQKLTDTLGRTPTKLELADHMKVSPAYLDKIQKYNVQAVGQSTFEDQEGNINLPGVFRSDPRRVWMDYIMISLHPTDRFILAQSQAGKSKKEIALKLKISPAAVTQRSAKIAAKINEIMTEAQQ
jgi:DNA-directed RNA polymerase specialized sigma subunit